VPDSAGDSGGVGCVADYLQAQGALDFLAAADRYLDLHRKLVEALEHGAATWEAFPAQDNHGPAGLIELLDPEFMVDRYCSGTGIRHPVDAESCSALHIEAGEAAGSAGGLDQRSPFTRTARRGGLFGACPGKSWRACVRIGCVMRRRRRCCYHGARLLAAGGWRIGIDSGAAHPRGNAMRKQAVAPAGRKTQRKVASRPGTVVFAHQSAIMDPPFTRLDILTCRTLGNVIDGVVIAFSDISEAKRLEAQLREALACSGPDRQGRP
jgi:hypothetical protein